MNADAGNDSTTTADLPGQSSHRTTKLAGSSEKIFLSEPIPGQNSYDPNPESGVVVIEGPPPNYLKYTIFVTVCCFWPIGVMAIMRAADSQIAAARGDLNFAQVNARKAKKLANIALGVGIAVITCSVLLFGSVFLVLLLNTAIRLS